MSTQAQKVIDGLVKILTALSTAGILALFSSYNSINARFTEAEVVNARNEVRLQALTEQLHALSLCQTVQGERLHDILVQLARLSPEATVEDG